MNGVSGPAPRWAEMFELDVDVMPPVLPEYRVSDGDDGGVWFFSGMPAGSVVTDRLSGLRYLLTGQELSEGVFLARPLA